MTLQAASSWFLYPQNIGGQNEGIRQASTVPYIVSGVTSGSSSELLLDFLQNQSAILAAISSR